MPAKDVVIYNGIEMRRDYAESLESAQRCTHYSAGGKSTPRIRFGDEIYPMVISGAVLCPCCSAARGQLHEPLCEREQCPVCMRQVISCNCDFLVENALEG
jgi:H2-forming N5,N10-methylenetetrahydromethanopterin dehydrogenase-like enzyme